ncbi:rxlr effector candidate protein [Gigaspora margarita]|uniref:Rxlr effector candidate protein n=1 Tax=Gigaspora margarita TaxID=4874 RepID=A0A8H4AY13_GIGMA|nr:rxlr effector candidate protein [Gigaspora margarita]
MTELYRKAGGVPRYTLQRVEEAMKYYDPETISGESIHISNCLIHRWSNHTFDNYNLGWASNYIFEEVTKKLEVRAFLEQIRNYKAYPSARGIMLELYVIHLFITGDCHFETRKLEDHN